MPLLLVSTEFIVPRGSNSPLILFRHGNGYIPVGRSWRKTEWETLRCQRRGGCNSGSREDKLFGADIQSTVAVVTR